MDLRDRFAAHFAAALVDAFTDAGQVARRAYDLAEAMLEERARRFDAEEGEPRRDSIPAPVHDGGFAPKPPARAAHYLALLDEPEPMILDDDVDPGWLEPPYDPSWDLEARWSAEPRPGPDGGSRPQTPGPDGGSRPQTPGPGLARTQPEEEEAQKNERSA